MKMCGGSRGIAPPVLNLGIRGRLVVNLTSWPLYSWEQPRYQLNWKFGESQSLPGRFGGEKKSVNLVGIRNADCPAHSAVSITKTLTRLLVK